VTWGNQGRGGQTDEREHALKLMVITKRQNITHRGIFNLLNSESKQPENEDYPLLE
jgi:hypothetical protein